jgi:ATP-dependent RNA helicase DHX37/DHR1
MKAMHIDAVVNFPFPTAPDRNALASAERTLVRLGAVAPGTNQITDLGRVMALFPLVPRFAKMLANGRQKDCLAYVIAIVSSLSVGDPFLREEALEGEEDEEAESEVLEHITGEASRAKEARRLRRRAFFESQHVSLRVSSKRMAITSSDRRRMAASASLQATSLGPYLLWGRMSMLEETASSVRSISFAQR